MAGIQENKWFGSNVWSSGGYTFLHFGQPLPSEEEKFMRNEGVGIALDETATAAWREAGEVWKAVSSRVIMARLKLTKAGQNIVQQLGGEPHDQSSTVEHLGDFCCLSSR